MGRSTATLVLCVVTSCRLVTGHQQFILRRHTLKMEAACLLEIYHSAATVSNDRLVSTPTWQREDPAFKCRQMDSHPECYYSSFFFPFLPSKFRDITQISTSLYIIHPTTLTIESELLTASCNKS